MIACEVRRRVNDAGQPVELRVDRLEGRVGELETLPARVTELGAQIAQLRSEMRAEFSAVRGEMRAEFYAVRAEMKADLSAVRDEMRADLVASREQMRADLAASRDEMRVELSESRSEGAANLAQVREEVLAKIEQEISALRGPGGEGLTLVGLRQEIRDGDEETRRQMRVLHEDLVQRIALLGEARPRRRKK